MIIFPYSDDDAIANGGDGADDESGTAAAAAPTVAKRSAWSRPNKKAKTAAPKKRGITVKSKAPVATDPATAAKQSNGGATVADKERTKQQQDSAADSDASGDESDAAAQSSGDDEKKPLKSSTAAGQSGASTPSNAAGNAANNDDDDVEWEKFQQKLNRREKLEGKSKMSHSVHCPNYPEDKQEYWWTYICDRKSRTLLTAPYHVTNLVDSEEIQLKFTAPRWPGVYTFTVCLRSGECWLFFNLDNFRKYDIILYTLLQYAALLQTRTWAWTNSRN